MKKYLFGLMALLFALSITAFTIVSEDTAKGKTTPLYWFEYDPGEDEVTSYLDHDERAAFLVFGCQDDSGPDCRRGYPITALINSGDPGQGVTNPGANLEEIQLGE